MTDFSDTEQEEITPEEYLRSLNIEDFMTCESTKNILIEEHYNKFDRFLEKRLIDIYEKYNEQYQDVNCLFKNDLDAIDSHAFASMIYNFISLDVDLNIFYDCPELAKDLLPK